jgi:hypothetical protein
MTIFCENHTKTHITNILCGQSTELRQMVNSYLSDSFKRLSKLQTQIMLINLLREFVHNLR